MDRDHQIYMGFRRFEGVLEGEHVESLSHGPIQIHQLYMLRHVSGLPSAHARKEGDYKP